MNPLEFDEEEWPRINSANIPSSRSDKWKRLQKAMHKMTGTKKSSSKKKGLIYLSPNMNDLYLNYQEEWDKLGGSAGTGGAGLAWVDPLAYKPSYDSFNPEPPKDHRLVVFYGFNGMLAHKYSIVNGMGMEEIEARMMVAKNKISYRVMYMEEFGGIAKQFPDQFQEITFDDALNTIRIGVQEVQDDFVDAEVDEFDDNCVEDCKPGAHACGK